MQRSCLLIIDVQEGFINEYTEHIPKKIERYVKSHSFDYVVATKYINRLDTPCYLWLGWEEMMESSMQNLVPIIDGLAERTFLKTTYSCFTEEFEKFLMDEEIAYLYLVGIDTDCCVLKTAFDCFDREIPFCVVLPCCASSGGDEFHQMTKQLLLRSCGKKQVVE